MKKLLRILSFILLPLFAEATHEVSGYISFKHISGTTYAVTIVTHTNGAPITDPNDGCNTQADRDTMRIYYGDGTSELLVRTNGPTDYAGYPGGTSECDCRKINIYQGNPAGHTFPGAGAYHMWMDDADRMYNIVNIPSSGGDDFYLFTTLIVDPFAGDSVQTPVITNPLVCEYACTGECYYYNLGAYSPQGDSIAYSLGNCLVYNGVKAPGYFIPPGATINPATGTLSWCNPTTDGIYNFSIRISSFKHIIIPGQPSTWRREDTMDVELEIIVNSSCDCTTPTIKGPTDTCVIAGSLISFNYIASDTSGTNSSNQLSMTATGEPFTESPASTFTGNVNGNPLKYLFKWQTNCSEVRNAPYTVTVKAVNPCTNNSGTGGNGLPLHSYLTTNIHVIGPAITGLKAQVLGNDVKLTWNPSVCNQVTGYNVYRAIGCVKFVPGPCQTGVPASSGYTFIGTTSQLNYTDSTAVPGIYYSYLVCGVYPIEVNSLSIASNDTCVLIRRNIPLLTNVSVSNTSTVNGNMFVRWIKPKVDSIDFDTNSYPGPYTYTLLRASGTKGTNYAPVVTRTYPYFGSATDTTYMDTHLDTQDSAYRYKLAFYWNTSTPIGSVPPASSLFLGTRAGNDSIRLQWKSLVPWTDSAFMIYRGLGGAPFTYLTSVAGSLNSYTDTGLTNGKNFCYYIVSKSYYSDTSIMHPLYDSSEIVCATPKDTVPPCPPVLSVTPSCYTFKDSLVWNNPDHTCKGIKNTVKYYNIYYSATEGGDMQVIETVTDLNDTVFVKDSLASVAGCYAVTAVDSFGNESRLNTVCVDNCPQYTLPNVFTPNGDGQNDLFTPILPYRYIHSIDINIFNRWGQVMFHTNDPMINWDGTDQVTHGKCPDGVYYYICVVNEIRVTGIQPVTLKGFVQIIR